MAPSEATHINGQSEPSVTHVLHVVEADVLVRFGRMFRHLALALGTEGLHVSLLTDDPRAVSDFEGTPVECHLVRRLSGWWAWQLPHYLEEKLDPPPQVAHLWGTQCLASVGQWAQHSDLPVVVHALSAQDVANLMRRGPHQEFHWLAGCEGLVEIARAESPALPGKFHVVPPAFLMPEAAPDDDEPDAGHTLGVLWAGRIDAAAGLATLVDAVGQLCRQGCDVQVALVGAGPGVPALREHIRRASVQSCISLVDEPRLWDQAMHGADVFVVPASQRELSLAPLLAMALGKIVVASRDQMAEWFIEDQTAWQFTPGSAVELAYHLTRAAARDRAAQELSRAAMTIASERYAIGRIVEDLVREYTDAAKAGLGNKVTK
jgi:glycosyltransferase involved in cell wall biosynthesis